MKLKDIMTPNVECVRPGETLQEAARKMKTLDVGSMPVRGENDKIVGILTDRDITIRATAEGKDPQSTRVQDAMSDDVVWCFEDEETDEASRLMQEHQARRLLVMDGDKRLVGIVSLGDLATEDQRRQAGAALERVSEPCVPHR
ncbi:MAG: CBS domain-containing protein [Isosphaeraceae bacterium]